MQFDELSCLSVPPARELRDLHKDLWLRLYSLLCLNMILTFVCCRFGREESSTIKRLASVQERLKQQQVLYDEDALSAFEALQLYTSSTRSLWQILRWDPLVQPIL